MMENKTTVHALWGYYCESQKLSACDLGKQLNLNKRNPEFIGNETNEASLFLRRTKRYFKGMVCNINKTFEIYGSFYTLNFYLFIVNQVKYYTIKVLNIGQCKTAYY